MTKNTYEICNFFMKINPLYLITLIITTLKFDTTYVYSLNPEKSETLDILFRSLPLILLVLGIIANHLYNKWKTRTELKETKNQLKHSLQILEIATETQADYITTFKAQFETNDVKFEPIGLDVNLSSKNVNSVATADLYKIFITKVKGDIEQKSGIYNKFNYVVTIVEKCEKHLEEDMNKYTRRNNEIGNQLNSHNQLLRTLMNEWIGKKINENATEDEIEFINFMQIEHKKLYESGEMNNIFYAVETFHKPLLKKALDLNIEQFINILPLGIAILNQFKNTRKNYYEIYNHLEDALRTSNEYLKIILASKTFR